MEFGREEGDSRTSTCPSMRWIASLGLAQIPDAGGEGSSTPLNKWRNGSAAEPKDGETGSLSALVRIALHSLVAMNGLARTLTRGMLCPSWDRQMVSELAGEPPVPEPVLHP